MSNGLEQVINYMIPAIGTPRGYFWTGTLSSTPVTIDFRNVSGGGIDGQPFRPSGVFIDNTRGTGNVVVTINEISYQMICLQGELLNLQFPAPVDLTVSFIGLGEATLAFVDFPVLPYRNLAAALSSVLWGSITGTLSDQTDLQSALDSKLTNPMTTPGDLIVGTTGGTPVRLALGSNGQVLKISGGIVVWDTDVGFANPMTTTGDLIYSSSGSTPARRGIGSTGDVLTVSGGVPTWAAPTGGMTNPLTTTGDLIYSSSGTTPARRGIGSTGDVLTVSGGLPTWAAPTGMTNPMTTTGDLIYSSSGSTPARRAIGSSGQVLTVSGGVPTWATPGALTQTGIATSIASGDDYPFYSGRGPISAVALTSTSRCHFSVVNLESPLTFTDISIAVTGATASQTIDVGIYNMVGAGKPGTCAASVQLSTTSTGRISGTIGSPVTLQAGTYFCCLHGSSTSPTIAQASDAGSPISLQMAALGISNFMVRAAAGSTILSTILLADSSLPGGSYTRGMDMTGLNMTSASIVGYNSAFPLVGLVKQ